MTVSMPAHAHARIKYECKWNGFLSALCYFKDYNEINSWNASKNRPVVVVDL